MSGKRKHAERLLTRMHAKNRAYPSVWLRGDPSAQPVAVEERLDDRADTHPVNEADGERSGLVGTTNERDTVELDASASPGVDDTRGIWTDLFDIQFRYAL